MGSTLLPAGLVVLRAPAGCGKSTFADRLATQIGDPEAVIATDEIRAEITGDATDMSRDAEVFALRDRRVQARLRAGLSTVADSTNLSPKTVIGLVALAHTAGMPVVVVDCAVPLGTALARNASRDRVVPESVIRRHFAVWSSHSADDFRAAGVDEYFTVDQVSGWVPTGIHGEHLTGPFDVIGDVHGQFDALCELMTTLGYRDDWSHPEHRTPVFVGDIVDKGPAPVAVLDAVASAHRRGRALLVKGNHEHKLVKRLAAIDGVARTAAQRRAELLSVSETANDGQALTLRGLADDRRCDTGFSELVRWMSRLPNHLVLDGGKLVVVHAAMRSSDIGVDSFPSNNARRRAEGWCLYGPSTGRRDPVSGFPERIDWIPDYDGDAVVVRGHVTVEEPEIRNNVASVDVGAGDGVALGAFRWPERTFSTVDVAASAVAAA